MDEIFGQTETVIDKKWNSSETKLLITERLKLEEQFISGKRKKSVIWGIVLYNIKAINSEFKFSREEIMKKFGNLLTTYHRIKQRNQKTGRSATLWEYWDQFNEVYGHRHSNNPPQNILIGTFDVSLGEELNNEKENNETSENTNFEQGEPVPKKKKNDLLNFFQEEARKDEQRLKELIEIEKESVSVEKEKVKELKEMKEILKSLLNK